MISKTIGCRGTLFSDKPTWCRLGAILVPSWCHREHHREHQREHHREHHRNSYHRQRAAPIADDPGWSSHIFPTSEVRDKIEWQWVLSGLSLVQILRLDLEDQGKANSAGLNLFMTNRQTHFPALRFQSWGYFLGWSPCGVDADLCSCFIHPHRPGMNKNYNELQI